jgi:hypothetical protein
MTAEGAGTSISSLDAHFLKLRRYAELGSIRSLKVPLGEDVSSEVGLRVRICLPPALSLLRT